jgi:PLP dependent protein
MTEKHPDHSKTGTEASNPDMRISINPQRAQTLLSNISRVHSQISSQSPMQVVRLVAVSKLKPASDILALHQPSSTSETPPQVHFGENYIQELLEKSKLLPKTIHWHFIGGLQSNKCLSLARDVDSLWAVESVDSKKKAGLLNKGRGERNERLRKDVGMEGGMAEKLNVFVQVNTSDEDSKSGLAPKSSELLELAKFIHGDECPNLHLQGLMTIGAIARSQATTAETENGDFVTLKATRDKLEEDLSLAKEELELSMGMSVDFESAVRMGSNEVRIGSTIFGERPPKKDTKVIEDVETEKS